MELEKSAVLSSETQVTLIETVEFLRGRIRLELDSPPSIRIALDWGVRGKPPVIRVGKGVGSRYFTIQEPQDVLEFKKRMVARINRMRNKLFQPNRSICVENEQKFTQQREEQKEENFSSSFELAGIDKNKSLIENLTKGKNSNENKIVQEDVPYAMIEGMTRNYEKETHFQCKPMEMTAMITPDKERHQSYNQSIYRPYSGIEMITNRNTEGVVYPPNGVDLYSMYYGKVPEVRIPSR